MKYYKILFSSTLILGTLTAISSLSWMGMWLGLEINLISLIPLLKDKSPSSSEASIKYFLTQAMASALFIFSLINMTIMYNTTWILILNSSLLMKMGAAPFHFWFPEVMDGLNWMNSFIMLTWQKIAPMIIITYNSNLSMFFLCVIILSMMIGSIMGLNQTSMRKILTFSSINHIGWMIPSMLIYQSIWVIYMMVYSMILLNIIYILNLMKIYFINQLMFIYAQNWNLKMFFSLNFFSLGGLPPFLGFYPKWLVINMMIVNKNYFVLFLMIIFTLITLYYYTRIMFNSLTISNLSMFFNMKFNFKYWKLMNFIFMFCLPLIILFSLML